MNHQESRKIQNLEKSSNPSTPIYPCVIPLQPSTLCSTVRYKTIAWRQRSLVPLLLSSSAPPTKQQHYPPFILSLWAHQLHKGELNQSATSKNLVRLLTCHLLGSRIGNHWARILITAQQGMGRVLYRSCASTPGWMMQAAGHFRPTSLGSRQYPIP